MEQIAGYQSGRVVTPRQVLRDNEHKMIIGGIMSSAGYDGGNTNYESYIRGGWLLGLITATKKWVPCKRTTTTSSGAVTALAVVNAAPFKVGDAIDIGADTNIVISAINYSTNTLTIPTTTVASGEAVVARDGSQIARGILLNDEVELYDYERRTLKDKPIQILIGGLVYNSMLLGDVAACVADTSGLIAGRIFRDSEYGF